jgi:hypothetical protein
MQMTRKTLAALLAFGLGIGGVGLYWSQSQKLTAATRALAAEIEELRSGPGSIPRLEGLRRENEQLGKDLHELRRLEAESEELRDEVARLKQAAAMAQQNPAHGSRAAEEERKRQEIVSIWSNIKSVAAETELKRLRIAAEKRLQEKRSFQPEDPLQVEAEYAALAQTFADYAAGLRQGLEFRKMVSPSLPPNEVPAAIREAWKAGTQFAQTRIDSLGPDQVLYQRLPFPAAADPVTTPILRSVLPDQRGVSVTVYLDGRAQFSTGAAP